MESWMVERRPRAFRHAAQGCAECYPGFATRRFPYSRVNRNAVPSRFATMDGTALRFTLEKVFVKS